MPRCGWRRVWLCLLACCLSAAPAVAQDDSALYRQLLDETSFSKVSQTYRAVAAFGSRLEGSKGEQMTYAYVEQRLRDMGAKLHEEPFTATVPDPAANGLLSVGKHSAQLEPLWPNLVRTSTCHATGPLLYVGNGSLEELNGLEIKGSIAIMEFNSGSHWRNLAKLGAAAVVFLQPSSMPRAEAEAKFSSVPLDIPRFYLPMKQAGPMLTAAFARQTARLDCTQNWVSRPSGNLVADFPGTDPALASEPIAVMAYADSISITPGESPGAESIGGIAGLLEIARIYSATSHARPLELILARSHSLALRGAREFVHVRMGKQGSPLITVTLDFSSGSPAIGSYGRGWFYEVRDESQWGDQQISSTLRKHIDTLAKVEGVDPPRLLMVDAVNNGDDRTWKNNIPGKFALDCEPMVLAGMNALTFRTIEDGREKIDTPFDTLDRVRISNVFRQIGTSVVLMHHLLTDPRTKSGTQDDRVPLDIAQPVPMRLTGGFGTVAGQVTSYDPQKSFMPDTKETGTLACVVGTEKSFMGVRGDMVQYTDPATAQYRFDGVPTVNSFPDNTDHITHLEAFRLDQGSGKIVMAPTWELPGFSAYETYFALSTSYKESPIVVFPAASVDLYDMVDPQNLTALTMTMLFDADTGSRPRNFGIFEPTFDIRLQPDIEDAQVVFLIPGQHFQVLSGARGDFNRLILTDTTPTDEKGSGYVAPGGKAFGGRSGAALSGVFDDVPLETAIDISNLNEARLARFRKYRILNEDVEHLQNEALSEIEAAKQSAVAHNWAAEARHARAAWGFALRDHPIIMGTANDVVNGVVFYLFLLIPFSYFLERLLIGNRLLTRQLTWAVGFFVASFILLRLIHPAFEIVTNPSMVFIAFVMGALSLIVISFILSKFETSMRDVRQQQSGHHDVDIRRSSVAMAAFNLGVSNMRRRKARTVLTTLTLVVMTFIVLSFTSIVSKLVLDQTPSNNEATYSGILIRNPGLDPLELATYGQVQNEFAGRASVVRRAYYYGADIGNLGILSLQSGDNVAEARAMLGLDAGENEVLQPQQALYAGRWFRPGERNVMVLPQTLAEELKIDPSEVGKAKVDYAGSDYTVVGLANTSVLRSLHDLDGDGLMPADFSTSKDYQEQRATSNQAFRSYIRLDPGSIFILPAETAMQLGADLRTVAIHFTKPDETETALESLMPRLRLNLYAGVPDVPGSKQLVVREFSVQEGSASTGAVIVFVQLLIAGVFVLNTMIASVYERTREIAIFSSIGLAPNHISILFFAESLVYGILGSVIGYFVAQLTAKIIVATNTLHGLTLNFSSTSAVLSAGLVMAVVLGSTIYPARKAAKIAAPAMNEEVFETEPEGDIWELPLPFSIGADEAEPISRFLLAWLKAYEGYTIGEFVSADSELHTSDSPMGRIHTLSAVTWLTPFDLGVSQRLQLKLSPSRFAGVYLLDLTLQRLAGDPENWTTVNRRFLAGIRREFLTWRTLRPEDRAKYRPPDAEAGSAEPEEIVAEA